jgi:hypothetical protein
MATTKKTTTTKKVKTTKKQTPRKQVKAQVKTTKKVTASKAVSAVAKSTTKKVEKPSVKSKKAAVKTPKTIMQKLNIWNWVLAGLHAAQGVAVVILSKDALFPVTTSYLTVDPIVGTAGEPALVLATRHLFDINLAYTVAAFFFMSSLAHLYIATIYRKKYEHNLEHGLNKARWFEYALSASTMMLGIAMLAGVTDISTLALIFGATAVMNLCGLIMEVHNQHTPKTNWLSFNVGTLAGIFPWVAVGLYMWGANQYGDGQIPTFVYWIYVSMFVFFSSFALNMWLQYRKKGKWADYIYGEKAYMVLSLVAKSLLAWQVFAGTLRP